MSELNLENLKTLRGIYAKAIETGEVPVCLKLGLCRAYSGIGFGDSMYSQFKQEDYKYDRRGFARDGFFFVWPTIMHQNASIEQALVPGLNWLDNKIKEIKTKTNE